MALIVTVSKSSFEQQIQTQVLDLDLIIRDEAAAYWHPWSEYPDMRNTYGIPVPGDRIADLSGFSYLTDALGATPWPLWKDTFRCRSVRYQSIDNSRSAYRCLIRFSDHQTYCPGPFARRSDSSSIRFADRYRDENPTSSTADNDDVTSTTVKGSGDKPERFPVSQIRIQIEVPWLSDEAAYTDGYPNLDDLFGDKWGKVNSNEFLGFPAGSVMFDSASVDEKEDEFIAIVCEFTYDSWFHMNQEPVFVTGSTQHVQREVVGTKKVPDVKWRSMSTGSDTFGTAGTIFDADTLAWARDGWKAWDTACTNMVSGSYSLTAKKPLTNLRTASP